ncbi:MATE family efflux transporter, partial [Capnocytophaga sp.]|uniref:MATE family efflux transporter n=1 Tax=Capnocytophaga sp. TaxID=44737 RepID=UPI0026DD4F51
MFLQKISTYTNEFKQNLKIAYPVIFGMLGHAIVGLVDNIMVGKVGVTELAAVALGNSAVFIAMSFGIGFSVALTPLVAKADGEKNPSEAKSILKHGFILNTSLSIILFALMLFAEPLMRLTSQPENVVKLAIPYTNLVAFSLIPLGFYMTLKQFADGLSLTKQSMYVTLIGNVINVVLNYLFIYGSFGFPKLGIIGAGIGTLVSRFAMPFLLWWMLRKLQQTRELVVNFNWRKLEKHKMRKIIALGIPSGLQMIFEVGIFTTAIWLSGILGENHLSANQIALNLATITFMVANGLGVTAMIRVGNQLGSKNYLNLRKVGISVFLLVFFTQTFFAILLATFRYVLPSLYLDMNDVEKIANNLLVVDEAAQLLLVAAIFQISDGLQVTALGALRGLQDVKAPMYITFVAYWVVSFPVSYFLGLKTSLGTMGIWIGLL